MKLVPAIVAATLIGTATLGTTLAQHSHDHNRAPGDVAPTELVLPDNLRGKLVLEMQAISVGMGTLLNHLARGEAELAAEVAGNIRDTFLLKQELSQEELKELISLLPEDFITMDRAFHGTAGKLSAAAASGDFNAAIEHYTTMSRACINCHVSYAGERFPAFNASQQDHSGHDH